MDQHPQPLPRTVFNVAVDRVVGRRRGTRGGRGRAVQRVRNAGRLVNQALVRALQDQQGRNDADAELRRQSVSSSSSEDEEAPLAERQGVPPQGNAAAPPPGLEPGVPPQEVPPQPAPRRPPGLDIVQVSERREVTFGGMTVESGPVYELVRPTTASFAEVRKAQPADLLEQLVAALQLEMKGTIRKADHQQVASRRAKQILEELSPKLPPKERLGLVSAAVNQVVGITPTEEGYRRAAGGLGVRNPKFPAAVDSWQQANELAQGRIYYSRPRSGLMRICTLGLVDKYDSWRMRPGVVSLLGPHRMEAAIMPK